MENIFCKVLLSGCLSHAEYYFEIPCLDSEAERLQAAQAQYEARFGVFKSSYCDQCFDYTSLSFELFSRKQSKQFLRRWLSKPERFSDAQVFRLS